MAIDWNWLPADHVLDIAVSERAVYIATEGGLGIIRYEPYTLLKKSLYYERALEDWGFKRLGFVHKLNWSGDKDGWWREISDNDGGHTCHYLSAMTFKYAATGDEQARLAALDAFQAMIWLGDITKKPGFIARAIWSVKGDRGARSRHGSGGLPAKWYPTDDGLWLWNAPIMVARITYRSPRRIDALRFGPLRIIRRLHHARSRPPAHSPASRQGRDHDRKSTAREPKQNP